MHKFRLVNLAVEFGNGIGSFSLLFESMSARFITVQITTAIKTNLNSYAFFKTKRASFILGVWSWVENRAAPAPIVLR